MNNLNPTNFEQDVLKAEGVVLVDFFADWSGPCQMLTPILEKLSGEFAGKVTFLKLDTSELEAKPACMQYGVSSLPTLIVFKDGEVVNKISGLRPERTLREMLTSAISPVKEQESST